MHSNHYLSSQWHKSLQILLEIGATNRTWQVTGLKITTGQRTMSGQDDHLSGRTISWLVILTGQVHGFKINNLKK